ncbi:MAG: hypothetical protein KDI79_15120 [Anaerolineae bacterium]|nr:hypothetical protein [Anaerolineae bacterium]
MKRTRIDVDRLSALRFTFHAAQLAEPNRPLTPVRQVFDFLTARFDPYLLLVWLFALPALSPLWQPTITDSADGLLHLYRLVALDQAVRQGDLFPRWLPDLAYGYGFPLFVFYAPLAYYLTLILSFGTGLVPAFNISFGLALLLSGTGVFLLVRDRFGSMAGLLAGVAYVYAPFQLFNAFSRGGLPAAWAMALFPFTFWAFGRLLWPGDHPRLLFWTSISAMLFGLALLTHNTLSLLFTPLLVAYLIVSLLVRFILKRWTTPTENETQAYIRSLSWTRTVLPVSFAVVLGLGLAAFFLLPAIIEKEYAQVYRVITSPDFDFRFHFVSLTELLAWPEPANTGLLNPKFPLTLGLVQVGLAVIGLVGLVNNLLQSRQTLTQRIAAQLTLGFFAASMLLIAVLMMLPLSQPLWERLPLLEFIQFPYRWLGPSALMLAILAGAAGPTLPERAALALTLVGIAAIFFSAVPLLYPRYNTTLPADPSLVDMMAYEHRSGVIGTTSFGEYLPIWVKTIPRESPLEPMYQTGRPIERFDASYLPYGAEIASTRYEFNRVSLTVESPEPFQAIFNTFYFPGWVAKVDKQPAPTVPFSDRGLIRVDVPPGRHKISLHFQETKLRRVANWLSVAALFAVLGVLALSMGHRTEHVYLWLTPDLPRSKLTLSPLIIFTSLACLLIALKMVYFDHVDSPLKQTYDGAVVGIDVPRQVNFGSQIDLIGYDLAQAAVQPGQAFDLTAYWQARQPVATAYSALAQLVDHEGHLYTGQDNLHPGGLPTSDWQSWGFVRDSHTVLVPWGTPPGDYFLTTGLYDPATWQRLPVLAGGDSGWPDVIAIPVTVDLSDQQPALTELDIAWPQNVDLNADLRLLGATPERDAIVRNDFLRLALFWEAKQKPQANYQIAVRLVNEQKLTALEQSGAPSFGRYPTRHWSPGERVRDNHAFWIPADFPAGRYRLQVRLLDKADQPASQWVDLGTMTAVE